MTVPLLGNNRTSPPPGHVWIEGSMFSTFELRALMRNAIRRAIDLWQAYDLRGVSRSRSQPASRARWQPPATARLRR
jgi:hypothetical protein